MKLKDFKELIELFYKTSELSSSLYKLNIDIINLELPETKIINILLNEVLTKDGIDWFEWYVYERAGRKDMTAYDDSSGERVPICYDDKSLYKYLKQNKYFKLQES